MGGVIKITWQQIITYYKYFCTLFYIYFIMSLNTKKIASILWLHHQVDIWNDVKTGKVYCRDEKIAQRVFELLQLQNDNL